MVTYVNARRVELDPGALDRNLLQFLREDLDLTGAKNGCGIGACGACVVLVNHQPVRSCKKAVRDIVDKQVLTIEGMTGPGDSGLHPLQQAFVDHGAIQCGFCTPGMVLTAHAFLLKNQHPTRDQIRRAISANLCRCTGYQQIVDAIEAAAAHYR
jgi:carbon-monoxide dehydrogenase small subunit